MWQQEDVPPLLSLSGLRQEFHRIETGTDAFIEEFFSKVRRLQREGQQPSALQRSNPPVDEDLCDGTDEERE
jgi:hypothetical protein